MKKILAISGGIDSMCLLHMLKDDPDIIVAHFNHGTRKSANNDEAFVKKTAEQYGLHLYIGKANLGPNVSEAVAREARYKFLRNLAKKQKGTILTAHHLNDFCESVAINFIRGTGWRGVMPLVHSDIARPMLSWPKSKIYQYAADNNLSFRQDPTNVEDNYLRNRIRPRVAEFIHDDPPSAMALLVIAMRQDSLAQEIEAIASEILPCGKNYPRAFFKDIDDSVAKEILRAVLSSHQISATRPQIDDFLAAIRTYHSGKQFNLPKDRLVKFNKTDFML